MAVDVSRAPTPFSPTSTLSVPSSPQLKSSSADILSKHLNNSSFPASSHIESIALRLSRSSAVFVYDLAEQVGFGTLSKAWSLSNQGTAPVFSLQTRSGAGLNLVGRLSQGSSTDGVKGAVLTAYTTPIGLATMAYSLSYLPPATSTSRLVIQVPNVTPVGDNFALSPSLSHLNSAIPILPNDLSIILSATARESVDLAELSYRINTHVVHLFNHHSASREIGHSLDYTPKGDSDQSLHDAIRGAGYRFFDYIGNQQANTVLVLLNGPLALFAKALVNKVPDLGIVVVRVLRPWDEAALLGVIPSTAKDVHVFDDVPSESSQGILYTDVLGSLLGADASIHAHRLVPTRTQELISSPSVFESYILALAPGLYVTTTPDLPALKNIIFLSTPGSTLSALPPIIEQTLLASNTISGYHLRNHDVLSRPHGITLDNIVMSPKGYLPPVRPEGTDLLVILDDSLLKSHAVFKFAKRGSLVLVITSWTSEELLSKLPPDSIDLINGLDLQICMFDALGLAASSPSVTGDVLQNALVYFTFWRSCLGAVAKENVMNWLTRTSSLGELLHEIDLFKLSEHASAGLRKIVIPKSSECNCVHRSTFDLNLCAWQKRVLIRNNLSF
jgi:sulfite reductase (NADPH) flavoprotein alpha-component